MNGRGALGFVLLATAVLVVACKRGNRVAYDPGVMIDSVPPLPAESLSMPEYPALERGHLNGSSTGYFDLTGSWTAQAETCDDPPMLVVQALSPGDRSIGIIALIHLPPEGDRLITYPIVTVDSGAAIGAVARIAVQDHRQRVGHSYEAYAGSLELSEFDDRVSGRFAVTMRDFQSDVAVKYAGVFHELPLARFPDAYCREYREGLTPLDSNDLRIRR